MKDHEMEKIINIGLHHRYDGIIHNSMRQCTTENQTVEATEQSEENQSDSVIVQVTAVEGDQITAAVGTLTTASADASGNGAPGGDNSGNGAPGDAPSGDAPSGDAPSGDNSGNGAPGGDAPSGDAPGGDAPSGQMPGGSSFEASGKSITFTLTDDTAITLEYLQGSDEGNADDIAVGSVLEVVLDEQPERCQIHSAQLKCRRLGWREAVR